MIPHVLLKISRCGECFGAKCTGVRLYLLVSHLVIVEVGGGREPFAAGLALVGLLSCVDPPVSVETGAGGELFTTEVTGVGSLSSVDPDVSLQQAGPVELLTTGLTGQQSLGCKFGFDPRFVLLHHIHLQKLVLRLPAQAEVAPGRVAAGGGGAGSLLLDGEVDGGVLEGGLHVLLEDEAPQVVEGGRQGHRQGRQDGGGGGRHDHEGVIGWYGTEHGDWGDVNSGKVRHQLTSHQSVSHSYLARHHHW